MGFSGLFIYLFVGVVQVACALYCYNGYGNVHNCEKGCCSTHRYSNPHCCEYANDRLLLGQSITLGISVALDIAVVAVFVGIWMYRKNKCCKSRVMPQYILIPAIPQGNPVTPTYPQTTPTVAEQNGGAIQQHQQQQQPQQPALTYIEPFASSSACADTGILQPLRVSIPKHIEANSVVPNHVL